MLSAKGTKAGTVELPDALFAAPVNEALIHQAVVRQLAGQRVGTADTLTRGQVTGGGRKPWRQKGTGRARQGSRTAPHWKGGGVVFGPHPRGFEMRMPAKMRRAALLGVLTAKAEEGAEGAAQAAGGAAPAGGAKPAAAAAKPAAGAAAKGAKK